jgi:integrase
VGKSVRKGGFAVNDTFLSVTVRSLRHIEASTTAAGLFIDLLFLDCLGQHFLPVFLGTRSGFVSSLSSLRVRKKLAPKSTEYPTPRSVQHFANDVLAPINRKQLQPESSQAITDFIENSYFPAMEKELRPSTVLNYRVSIYNKHLKARLGDLRLRDARTVHFQRMMRQIDGVSHRTLLHIKNFLSGVFRFARREGIVDGLNPLLDVTVPGRLKKFAGAAYAIVDVENMLDNLDKAHERAVALAKDSRRKIEEDKYETAKDVIALLSLSGLRQSEARGLKWSDWDEQNQTLNIARSVWGNKEGPTKNFESENKIPVLPLLQDLLKNRRVSINPKPNDYIFAGTKKGSPLNLHNLESRTLKPAWELARLNDAKTLAAMGSTTEPNKSSFVWSGFHGFRRGLATNLFDLGVHPKVIQGLLRHGDISTTMSFYIRERDTEARNALQKLEDAIKSSGANANGNE